MGGGEGNLGGIVTTENIWSQACAGTAVVPTYNMIVTRSFDCNILYCMSVDRDVGSKRRDKQWSTLLKMVSMRPRSYMYSPRSLILSTSLR